MSRKQPFKGKPRAKSKQNWTDRKKTESSTDVSKEKFNDPSWYITREQLAKDVASLSFNNALGAPISIGFDQDGQTSASAYSLSVPGIMSIYTVPTMGYSVDGASPINIAAKNIYSWVRHQNSGHANYDAPDLMLYLGAMDSVYAVIAWMMRVYGTARIFSQTNRYVGDALLTCQGVSPDEIRANLADFRSYLNMVITKASAFCTPNVMSLYRRHFWMYSGIYKDQDITKSQMYLYRPAAVWKYEETQGVGKLVTTPFTTTFDGASGFTSATLSFAAMRTFVNDMLSRLTASEDINIMSGDILKAYGRENLWILGLINEDYVTLPVYSDEVLSQIHNTTFVGRVTTRDVVPGATTFPYTPTAFDVYQDPNIGEGAIICNPQVLDAKHLGYMRIIDFDKEDPTPEDVLVATRNTVMGTPMIIGSGDAARIVTSLDTFASDVALFGYITTIADNGQLNNLPIGGSDGALNNAITTAMMRFKGAPIVYGMSASNTSAVLQFIAGELGNYTSVDWNDLSKMHESAILAMLGVPFYGVAK